MINLISQQFTLTADYQALFGENPAVFVALDFNNVSKLVKIAPVGIDRPVYAEAREVDRDDLVAVR